MQDFEETPLKLISFAFTVARVRTIESFRLVSLVIHGCAPSMLELLVLAHFEIGAAKWPKWFRSATIPGFCALLM